MKEGFEVEKTNAQETAKISIAAAGAIMSAFFFASGLFIFFLFFIRLTFFNVYTEEHVFRILTLPTIASMAMGVSLYWGIMTICGAILARKQ